MSNVVSIHPYFQIHPGKLEAAKALLAEFIKKTETEKLCLYYEFTLNDHLLFCREAYVGAEGLLHHCQNVQEQLGQMTAISDLVRVEIHGPAADLEQLKGPLGALNPQWFVYQCGVTR